MPSGFRVDVDSWVREYEEVKEMCQEILQIIQERNTSFPSGGPEASRATANARRKIGTLGTQLERMLKWLDGPDASELSEPERNRRRDMLYELRNRRESLQHSIKRTQPGQADRDALFSAPGSSGSKGGAGGGVGSSSRETERTAELDAAGLLQMQEQVMRHQDDELVSMERTIMSTKHIALAIGEEVDLQTRLLEDLEEDVDVTQSRLKAATARIKQVLQSSSTCKGGFVIFVLIVALVVLLLIGFKLHHLFSG